MAKTSDHISIQLSVQEYTLNKRQICLEVSLKPVEKIKELKTLPIAANEDILNLIH